MIAQQHNIDERLTVSQAAARANVTAETVRRWIHDERLTAFKTLTGTWRVDPQAIERLLGRTSDKPEVAR